MHRETVRNIRHLSSLLVGQNRKSTLAICGNPGQVPHATLPFLT